MKKFRFILTNLGVGLLAWMFLRAEINSVISPFFISFAFALFYIGNNAFYYIFGLFAARVAYKFSWLSVLAGVNLLLVIAIIKILQRKTKGTLKMGAVIPIMMLGSVVELVFCFGSAEVFVLGVINKILEVAFVYAYMVLFRAIKKRGTNTRLALDELLGLSLIIAPAALASAKITIAGVCLSQFVVPLCILLAAFWFGGAEAIYVALISGVGVAFKALDLTMIAVWILYAVAATGLRRHGRLLMAASLVVVELVVGFYFGVYENYSYWGLIPVAVAGLIFSVLPRRLISKINAYLYNKNEETCLNEFVIQEERVLKEKLKRISCLFHEMHNAYKNMVIGKLEQNQVEEVLLQDVVNENCKSCPKYKNCHEGKGLAYRAIRELVKKGISKKKVSLVDAPTMLVSSCGRTNQIINQLNIRLGEFAKYEKDLTQEDEAKVLMSNQLLGVSEIIDEFGMGLSFTNRVDMETEASLIDQYLYYDIIVKECAIYNDSNGFRKAIIVIKNAKYKKADVLAVASNFFAIKTKIADTRYTKISGWQVITLVPDTKYVYTFGVAKKSKHEKSGDTFSELRVDDTRALFAISDGKGCGPAAGQISETTLNLIENFYSAGFSSEHIMDNVNKIMSYKSGENFSAVDVCVIDLELGRADFIKRGGTPTVIKKGNRTQVIEGTDLPIGVMENSTSNLENYYLSSGDVVVLASDGVFDAFGASDHFAGFINNLPAVNMQEFSKNILSEAMRLNHGAVLDDMTVLAVKVLVNR